jgi:hypothetical protein
MNSIGNVWNWRRFAVNMLIGAATLAVAFATFDTGADLPTLLLPIALIAAGLALEPDGTANSPSIDSDARSVRLPAGIVDAASA